ncbi:hypothetical protein OUZ56_005689 [Daphnia magna]|uniref:Probable RNA-binding protein EIF1AD n=1 Tax=Daphnia magna TaxID=35525 RepID=A0ABQ9YTH0_9CRUS|nr:hypothetical protein OUZ56_005689 [Daphnia magna]
MLQALSETERVFEEHGKNVKMFVSETSLQAWRLTINSAINLIEEQFKAGIKVVLTGKFNQDPLERLFGIVRSVDSHPTVTSFLQIIRYVSLQSRLSFLMKQVKGSNIDNKEPLEMLVTMSQCLQQHAKDIDITVKDFKEAIKDKLLAELTIRYVDDIPKGGKNDFNLNLMVYDLCGYIVKTRKHLTACEVCKNLVRCHELDLPKDFTADQYTAMRNRGYLVYVTVPFFKTILVVELAIQSHFEDLNHIYIHDSFELCCAKIAELHTVPLFCDEHRDYNLKYLVMEYVKHVTKEVLDGYVLPAENQKIVKVLGGKGNNLHEVETAEGEKYLVSMPTKFRKNVWIKRGDYVLIQPIQEGEKVKAEILAILYGSQIKYIQSQEKWPKEFVLPAITDVNPDISTVDTDGSSKSDDDLFVNTNRPQCIYESTDDSDSDDSSSAQPKDKDYE